MLEWFLADRAVNGFGQIEEALEIGTASATPFPDNSAGIPRLLVPSTRPP